MWRPTDPFAIRFPAELPGVVCTFTVASREGEWSFVRQFGSPRRKDVPAEELYGPGVEGMALKRPVFFSSAGPETIRMEEGAIEFWVRPYWDVDPRRIGPRGSLAHTLSLRESRSRADPLPPHPTNPSTHCMDGSIGLAGGRSLGRLQQHRLGASAEAARPSRRPVGMARTRFAPCRAATLWHLWCGPRTGKARPSEGGTLE